MSLFRREDRYTGRHRPLPIAYPMGLDGDQAAEPEPVVIPASELVPAWLPAAAREREESLWG